MAGCKRKSTKEKRIDSRHATHQERETILPANPHEEEGKRMGGDKEFFSREGGGGGEEKKSKTVALQQDPGPTLVQIKTGS